MSKWWPVDSDKASYISRARPGALTGRWNMEPYYHHCQANLRKNVVSGLSAGWEYNCRMGTFFFRFVNNFWGSKKKNSYQKDTKTTGENNIAAARLATISATRWTENNFLLKGCLSKRVWNVMWLGYSERNSFWPCGYWYLLSGIGETHKSRCLARTSQRSALARLVRRRAALAPQHPSEEEVSNSLQTRDLRPRFPRRLEN